jgi:MarR family transcriptional regulator, organic hydroperoxide resistance regulator
MNQDSKSPFHACLLFSANALARAITKIADEAFAPTGLSYSHAFVLLLINKQPGIATGEIAKNLQLSPSTITRLIEKLESRGLVYRKAEGKNSRAYPTQKGLALDDSVREAWDAVNMRYTDLLGKVASRQLAGSVYEASSKLNASPLEQAPL